MVTWREREVLNEVRFRLQNEWISRTTESFGDHPSTGTFVCECGDGHCVQAIELTTAEYESVRSVSTHFAVARDHENPESEGVVRECPRFAVVDKLEGWGLRISRATDPRGGSGPGIEP